MKKLLMMLAIVSSLTMVGCKDTSTPEQSDIPQQEFQEEGDWEVNDHSYDITYYLHWYTRQDITNAFFDIKNNCTTCTYTEIVINYDVVTTYGVETETITITNLGPGGEIMNAKLTDCPPFGVLTINNIRIVSCY